MQPILREVGPNERIAALDLWRGFALLGVCVVNFFVANDDLLSDQRADALSTAPFDWRATFLLHLLVSNKAHTIFAFLFGIGIAIMARRASRAIFQPDRVLVRRLSILFALGLVHFMLLFHLDVLHRYALIGLLFAVLIRNLPIAVMASTGLVLAIFSRVLYEEAEFLLRLSGVPSEPLLNGSEFSPDQLYATNREQGLIGYVELNIQRSLAELRAVPEYLAITGHFLGRIMLGYAFWASGRGRAVLEWSTRRLLIAAIGFVVAAALLSYCSDIFKPSLAGTVEHFWVNVLRHCNILLQAAAYMLLLVVLLRVPALGAVTAGLVNVGRMSLTNYVLQTVGVIVVFTGSGLALGGEIGAAVSICLAVVFFLLQIGYSTVWLRHHNQGPLERVWRDLVYKRLHSTSVR